MLGVTVHHCSSWKTLVLPTARKCRTINDRSELLVNMVLDWLHCLTNCQPLKVSTWGIFRDNPWLRKIFNIFISQNFASSNPKFPILPDGISFQCLLYTFVEAKRIQFAAWSRNLSLISAGICSQLIRLIVGAADTLICESIVPHGPECFSSEQRDFYPVGSPDSFPWVGRCCVCSVCTG